MTKGKCIFIPVLLNIRSVHNVASIARTSNAVGVPEIITVGYTPKPHDRFGRIRKDFTKVSLGSEESLVWTHKDSIEEVMFLAKEQGATIVACEQGAGSIDYAQYIPKGRTYVVFGSETEGIPNSVLGGMDAILEIPMYGDKESLNVSVAVGVALYRMRENC